MCSKRPEVPHAPVRSLNLSAAEFRLALKNALRYIPPSLHEELGREFAQELREEGHIYMRRFRPTEYEMKAYPIDCYPAKSQAGAAMMLMIQNNLDHRVAQFPDELITYLPCIFSLRHCIIFSFFRGFVRQVWWKRVSSFKLGTVSPSDEILE